MKNLYKNEQKEDYSSFMNYIKEERTESSHFAKSLLHFVLGMCITLAFALWFVQQEPLIKDIFGEESVMTDCLLDIGAGLKNQNRTNFSIPFFKHSKNILLLGVDSNGEGTDKWTGTRTDTIILMNVDNKTRSINAISIPRDSKVFIPGNGVNKINSAHAFGGIRLTKKTIEDTLGVRIDKYIMVHDDAVKDIVNALDGIPIYVEKRMNYDDYSGKLHIHLDKGQQVLNGNQAVGFLRFRHDGLGDIGRTQRQQWFLKGLMEKLKSPQVITKLPAILDVARKDIKTDMSAYELSQLANVVRGLDEGGVQIATLPGGPNQNGHISYWVLDSDKVQEVIDRLIYRETAPMDNGIPITGGIIYTSSKTNEAEKLKTTLEEMGYRITVANMEQIPHSQFISHSNRVPTNFYNYLRKRIPTIDKMQYVYDPIRNYCIGGSDFTIVLSN